MNLETKLEPRLWDAVRTSLEGRHFSNAVLDAVHFLSDVIRERSGLEGDGVALIGAAFGGASPKLKVNRLQTESEQNVQRGIESILRGVYLAIRNPRSHGAHEDEERDAVAIILFLDYLLRIVDQSHSPFSLPLFVGRILDPDFVPKERYAQLLVREIPEKRRLAVCREIFVRRGGEDASKLRVFFKCVLDVMSDDDKNELWALVSDELRQTDEDATIRFVLGAFPETIWPQLNEIARLRIEHKLIRSAKEGRWLRNKNTTSGGALGTWASNIIGHFTLKDDLWRTIFAKLRSRDPTEQDYVFHYFIRLVRRSFGAPPPMLLLAIAEGLEKGDVRFKELAESCQLDGFDEVSPDSPWREPFAEALASFQAAPEDEDDVPF
jgi:uncharacterized protein (TIGR02391 family)